jgi:hypothetical protein
MVSIRPIALANVYAHALMTRIVHVEQHDRRASCGRAPDDAQTDGIPDKMLCPPLAARIAERDDGRRVWSAPCDAITAPFIAVTIGEGEGVAIV